MPKDWESITQHHLIPQELVSDWFNVNIPENIAPICRTDHDALHLLYWNQTPQKQLLALLDFSSTVIQPEIVEALKYLLTLPESEFYIPELLNRKHESNIW